jgi:hypothetical protein
MITWRKFVEMIQVKESVEVDELIDTCRRVGRQGEQGR